MHYGFLILVLFSGCYTNYKVLNSGNGVRSNIPIKTTFQVSKIDSILRFDEWEIPNDFVIGKTYNIAFKDSIRNPRKVKFFNNSNKYHWESNHTEYTEISNDFTEQGWYLISGLRKGGFDRTSFDFIIYHLDKNKKMKQYYRSLFDVNIH